MAVETHGKGAVLATRRQWEYKAKAISYLLRPRIDPPEVSGPSVHNGAVVPVPERPDQRGAAVVRYRDRAAGGAEEAGVAQQPEAEPVVATAISAHHERPRARRERNEEAEKRMRGLARRFASLHPAGELVSEVVRAPGPVVDEDCPGALQPHSLVIFSHSFCTRREVEVPTTLKQTRHGQKGWCPRTEPAASTPIAPTSARSPLRSIATDVPAGGTRSRFSGGVTQNKDPVMLCVSSSRSRRCVVIIPHRRSHRTSDRPATRWPAAGCRTARAGSPSRPPTLRPAWPRRSPVGPPPAAAVAAAAEAAAAAAAAPVVAPSGRQHRRAPPPSGHAPRCGVARRRWPSSPRAGYHGFSWRHPPEQHRCAAELPAALGKWHAAREW